MRWAEEGWNGAKGRFVAHYRGVGQQQGQQAGVRSPRGRSTRDPGRCRRDEEPTAPRDGLTPAPAAGCRSKPSSAHYHRVLPCGTMAAAFAKLTLLRTIAC